MGSLVALRAPFSQASAGPKISGQVTVGNINCRNKTDFSVGTGGGSGSMAGISTQVRLGSKRGLAVRWVEVWKG